MGTRILFLGRAAGPAFVQVPGQELVVEGAAVRGRDEGKGALLAKGSLSLADTPAGLLCSLPAPEVPP